MHAPSSRGLSQAHCEGMQRRRARPKGGAPRPESPTPRHHTPPRFPTCLDGPQRTAVSQVPELAGQQGCIVVQAIGRGKLRRQVSVDPLQHLCVWARVGARLWVRVCAQGVRGAGGTLSRPASTAGVDCTITRSPCSPTRLLVIEGGRRRSQSRTQFSSHQQGFPEQGVCIRPRQPPAVVGRVQNGADMQRSRLGAARTCVHGPSQPPSGPPHSWRTRHGAGSKPPRHAWDSLPAHLSQTSTMWPPYIISQNRYCRSSHGICAMGGHRTGALCVVGAGLPSLGPQAVRLSGGSGPRAWPIPLGGIPPPISQADEPPSALALVKLSR